MSPTGQRVIRSRMLMADGGMDGLFIVNKFATIKELPVYGWMNGNNMLNKVTATEATLSKFLLGQTGTTD